MRTCACVCACGFSCFFSQFPTFNHNPSAKSFDEVLVSNGNPSKITLLANKPTLNFYDKPVPIKCFNYDKHGPQSNDHIPQEIPYVKAKHREKETTKYLDIIQLKEEEVVNSLEAHEKELEQSMVQIEQEHNVSEVKSQFLKLEYEKTILEQRTKWLNKRKLQKVWIQLEATCFLCSVFILEESNEYTQKIR